MVSAADRPASQPLDEVGPLIKGGPPFCVQRIAGMLLVASTTMPAFAQEVPVEEQTIVVTGSRELLGIPVERSLIADDMSVYGLGTVGELIDEVAAENGEKREDPVLLVNGERVTDLADVEDFPAEAVERMDVLPTGSATRLGASANRRVYNIVLRRRMDIMVARGAARVATQGDWTSLRGDVTLAMSRSDIADHLGLRIETISRELSALKAARLIRLTSTQTVRLVDRERLEQMAEG